MWSALSLTLHFIDDNVTVLYIIINITDNLLGGKRRSWMSIIYKAMQRWCSIPNSYLQLPILLTIKTNRYKTFIVLHVSMLNCFLYDTISIQLFHMLEFHLYPRLFITMYKKQIWNLLLLQCTLLSTNSTNWVKYTSKMLTTINLL